MAYTGGDLIRDFLNLEEIPYVFGNPGTTETTFLEAVGRSRAEYRLARDPGCLEPLSPVVVVGRKG